MLFALALALLPQDSGPVLESAPRIPDQVIQLAESSLFSGRLTFDGNGRMRAASDFDRPGARDRHRGRMRLRIGAHYQLDKGVGAHARLSTASVDRDPNNPNWDFGDGSEGFEGGDLELDRFFVDWGVSEALELQIGKFGHVYSTLPMAGEFLWDADVQPAGLAATWSGGDRTDPDSTTDGGVDWDLRLVEYIAVETGAANEPTMFGVQGNVHADLAADASLELAASYSLWSNLDAGTNAFVNQGNTDVEGDFAIVDAFALYATPAGPWGGTQLFIETMQNLEADDGDDFGYVIGGIFGPSGSEGDMNLFASWYDLDADSVFSPVAQNDTPVFGTGTGSGMSGVIVGGEYFASDIMRIRVWGLTSDTGASRDAYRLRLDLDFQFR